MDLLTSVIICTHNPRPDYMRRVLEALRGQTLPPEQWELLFIDNGSKENLSRRYDLSWHLQSRHVREEEPGLTPARLRGIREARADLLIFVDDDNVLKPDYLEKAVSIAEKWPALGVWGSGQIELEFEINPPAWTRPYWYLFCLRDLSSPIWGNMAETEEYIPVGAGLCLRAEVAARYVAHSRTSNLKRSLDRRGPLSAMSCGDIDISHEAFDLGFGVGIFPELGMIHLIPQERLEAGYVERLFLGNAKSKRLLYHSRGKADQNGSLLSTAMNYLRTLRMTPLNRRFRLAELRGLREADLLWRKKYSSEASTETKK